MARLKLHERVLDITLMSMTAARAAWNDMRHEIPDSFRKTDVDQEMQFGNKRAIREAATRLYIWLEGYEAASN